MVPVVANFLATHLHVVPIYTLALAFHHADLHDGHLRLHTALNQVSLRIRLQRVAEERIVPALLRPAVALAPVLDGTPPGQAHAPVSVHAEVRLLQLVGHRLALEQNQVGLIPEVARIGIPLVVERGHLRGTGQLWRHLIRLEVRRTSLCACPGWEHGHGRGAGAVVAFQHLVKEAIRRDAPVLRRVARPVAPGLQLVS